MASIFEELMSVNSNLTESANPRFRRARRKTESRKIFANKIKVESRKIFEESDFDELEDEFNAGVNPENTEDSTDEVVLVIDPEIPDDEEVPEDAAQNLIGDKVYKCPVCGSNYVCDCETLGEEITFDEEGNPAECPICGDDADQILVGEIAPAEDAGEEVNLDPQEVDDETEEDEDIPEEEDDFDEEDVENESFKGRKSLRTEDFGEDDFEVEEGAPAEEYDDEPSVEVNADNVNIYLDDEKFESLIMKVIRENYQGRPQFKITRCSSRNGKLKIEYVIRESQKKNTRGVLIGEGFDKKSRKSTIKFVDRGAFTESFAKKPSFIVECVRVKNIISPVSVTYDYRVKMKESVYRVHGKAGLRTK